MPARCDCHDMLVEDCERLRGAEAREAEERRAEEARHAALIGGGFAIRARFPGQCAVCGDGITVGTPITLDKRVKPATGRDTGGSAPIEWVAACCLDDRGRIRT